MKGLIKLIAVMFVILLAAVVVIPLVILAGLFIWLKLTEEADDEALDLEADLKRSLKRSRTRSRRPGAVDFRHPADGGAVRPPQAGRRRSASLVDYDGTISLVDVGDALMARYYLDQGELARLERLYDEGKLGSRELMLWDMDVLPRDADLLRREAAAILRTRHSPISWSRSAPAAAELEVVSDGFGFYVSSNLAAIGLADVFVATTRTALAKARRACPFLSATPRASSAGRANVSVCGSTRPGVE